MIRIIKVEKDFTYACVGCGSMLKTCVVTMDDPLDRKTTHFVLCIYIVYGV